MMLEELVLAGGTTVVGAMATDSWAAVRAGVARLFRHRGEERRSAIEAQLDGNAELVAQAEDRERVRQSLIALWSLELESLLDRHPEAVDELRTLIGEIEAGRPAGQQTWVQTNVARDNGRVFASQGGNVIIHEAPLGGRSVTAHGAADEEGTGDAR
ncbi:hypothetical protein ACTPOK_07375 [Streptomyces inhibens]|uniref:hypothetical protein n=1 Tax=Streptomyces inhibens TaxID=2293571 RepID=UPI00402ACD37